MAPVRKCCIPFDKKKHNCFRKNLAYISENYDTNLSGLYGLYVCAMYKTQLYKSKDSVQVKNVNKNKNVLKVKNATYVQKTNENVRKKEGSDEYEEEVERVLPNKDVDYVCETVDFKIKRKLKLAAAIEEIIAIFKFIFF